MSDAQPKAAPLLKSIAETLLVAAVVFALGWGGMQLAQARHEQPITPDKAGMIRLDIRSSNCQGNTSFVEEDYSGSWHCEGDWKVWWRIGPTTTARYRVTVQLGCPAADAGKPFELAIDDQALRGTTPNTGGWSKWKELDVGEVSLAAGPHALTLRPLAAAATQPSESTTPDETHGTRMNLRKITLSPLP